MDGWKINKLDDRTGLYYAEGCRSITYMDIYSNINIKMAVFKTNKYVYSIH